LIGTLASPQAILVTSHILSEIEKIAQRVAILLHGRLLAVHTLQADAALPCVHLRVRGGPVSQVQAHLQAVPGVIAVTLAAESPGDIAVYHVRVSGGEATERLIIALVGHGFGVLEVRESREDLEAMFLQLTNARGTA
jgi:ABC-2 type transport system ATP-binding protein